MSVKYLHLTDAERPIADRMYADLMDAQREAYPAIQALGFDIESSAWKAVARRASLDVRAQTRQ